MPMVLEGEQRDPAPARPDGRHRSGEGGGRHHPQDFAASIEANAVHGSDSPQSAAFEIPYFFSALEIHAR